MLIVEIILLQSIKAYSDTPESINNFKNEVNDLLATTTLDHNLLADPNRNYNKFARILTDAKQKHIPTSICKVNKYKHRLSPWITLGLIKSIKYRDKLYKELKREIPDSIEYNTRKMNLHTYNCILQKNIRLAKRSYYDKQFNKYRNDIQKTWNTIKGILNKNKQNNEFPNYFLLNNSKLTNKQDIANSFNTFFTNIGPTLSNKIQTDTTHSFAKYLTEEILLSFEFKTVTPDDIIKTIQILKPKSSCGHDNISTKLLKHISPIIAPSLSLITNQSMCSGIFPDALKIARVIPLYKKDNPHIFDNYRPISLLPAVSKIIEKLVFKQLYHYFLSNELIYKNQYGFRDQHSTELAGLELTDRISKLLDDGKVPITVYLDLSKAFDTLDHRILLHKLQYYGIRGVALKWFKSYLCNRYQYVDIDGTESNYQQISTGVPQGSILGPLIFLIYMNDIHRASDKFHSILYADDTSLIDTLCSFNTAVDQTSYNKSQLSANINRELKDISTWLKVNKLSLNVKKTKFMLFHHKQRNIASFIPNLEIEGHSIEQVAEFNFLGLTVDQHMSWEPHVNKIANKISRTIGILCRLKHYLSPLILKVLYSTLIAPHLNYSILCWGFRQSRIFKLQKRAIRTITLSKYNAHTDPLFKTNGLLKLPDIFNWCCLKFFYKLENREVPHYFLGDFLFENISHTYNTRHRGPIAHRVNTTHGSKCIRQYLPQLLGEIPPIIKEKTGTHSYQGFSNYVKNYLIGQYPEECSIDNCYICSRNQH